MAGTTYVVLAQKEDKSWEEVGVQGGSNDLAAIKGFLERSNGAYGEGIYRAVPKRSWPDEPHNLKPKVSWV